MERLKHGEEIHLGEHSLVRIKCYDSEYTALVDTGASRSLISKNVLESLPDHIKLKQADIKHFIVANSDTLSVLGYVTVPVEISEKTVFMSFYVVTHLLQDVIIGRDFLRKCKAKIDFGKETLTLDTTEGLFSAEDTIIPPKSTVNVEMRLRPKQQGCTVEAIVKPVPRHELSSLIVQAKQKLCIRQGKVQITMQNKGTRPIKIPANQRFAVACQARAVTIEEGYKNCFRPYRGPHVKTYRRTDPEYKTVIDQIDFSNSVLTPEQQQRLKEVIWKERDVLSVKGDLGCLKNFKHEIKLKDNEPFNCPPYRLSPIAREVMRKNLRELEDQGVICRYLSDYSSPCMLVRKPGNEGKPMMQASHRLVCDLRELNRRSEKVKYQLPHIVETITQLDKSMLTYTSVIDLAQGYFQVPLTSSSRRYVTFRTDGLGSYALTRLPQGYVNSGEIFQSIMEALLTPEIRKYCHLYMDDLAITTCTFEKHLEVIQQVLDIFSRNGLTIKIEKSKFCQKQVKFLGYMIGREGVKMRPDKCDAIINAPRPKTVKQVRRFIGMIGWNRRFIKDFSVIAKPLHELTKKDKIFEWTDQCEEAFNKLKESLTTAPVLGLINYDKKLILVTDACDTGIGATLYQTDDDDGRLRVIAYYSRVLNPHESAYSITQKEALAIISSVRHFQTYLRFCQFEIKTDHRPLQYIFKEQKRPQENNRLIRWAMYLSGFDFTLSFTPGEAPLVRQSDWLSRESYEPPGDQFIRAAKFMHPTERARQEGECPDCMAGLSNKLALADSQVSGNDNMAVGSEAKNKTIPSETKPVDNEKPLVKQIANFMIPYAKIHAKLEQYHQNMFPEDKLIAMQRADEFCQIMSAYLLRGELPNDTREARRIAVMADQFIIDQKLLYHLDIPSGGVASEIFRVQLYLPETLRSHIINEIHSPMHVALISMLSRLRMEYWWPSMVTDIQNFINNCATCQTDKRLRLPYKPQLRMPRVPTGPSETWVLDHVGPLYSYGKKRTTKPKYILIAVDGYSLYTELMLAHGTTAQETARLIMDRIITTHSFPRSIRHDRGAGFTSKIMERITRGLGIKRYIGSAMHPQTQGLVERRVRVVSQALRKLVHSHDQDWYHFVPSIQLAMNSTPSRATSVTPFVLQHGRMPRDPTSLALIKEKVPPVPHREFLLEMAGRVKVWRETAARYRAKYRANMEKSYNSTSRVPKSLQPGELVYLMCPYLKTKYKGIRRLAIPYRGPFLVVEVIDNRLCRLARMADLTELPRLVPVSRLKLTDIGIDPPNFIDDPDITDHGQFEWVPEEGEVAQSPQDEFASEDEMTSSPGDVNTERKNDERPEIGADTENQNETHVKQKADKHSNKSNNPDEGDSSVQKYDVRVRIPPPVRVTRSRTKCGTNLEPTYREVDTIRGVRELKNGYVMVKIQCKGDPKNRTFWVSRQTLIGPDVARMIDNYKKQRDI